jgi:pheromone shutdown-related protein TraB
MHKIYENIILVGTSHVSTESVNEIKELVEKYNPVIIGIELDENRLKSLLSDKSNKKNRKSLSMLKEVGLFGYLFAQLAGFVQDKVGDSLKVDPGTDMLAAYNFAKEKEIPIALIDLDIRKTLKKLSKLSFRKKVSMFKRILFSGFKKENKEKLNFDPSKAPSDDFVVEAINIFRKEVPELYKILIEDRNKYMAQKLFEISKLNNFEDNILAVVGAGHVEGMIEELNKLYLNEKLTNNEHEVKIKNENNKISLSFNINVD